MTELRVGKALEISGIKIIPVESVAIQSGIDAGEGWWYGSKDVYALVINTPIGLFAMDQAGREMDITELIQKFPSLEAEL